MDGDRTFYGIASIMIGGRYTLLSFMDALVGADEEARDSLFAGRHRDTLARRADQGIPGRVIERYVNFLRLAEIVSQDYRQLNLVALRQDFRRLMVHKERQEGVQF